MTSQTNKQLERAEYLFYDPLHNLFITIEYKKTLSLYQVECHDSNKIITRCMSGHERTLATVAKLQKDWGLEFITTT